MNYFANDVVQKMAMTGKKEEIQTIIDKMPSVPLPNKLFHNTGKLKFEDKSKAWGMGTPSFSNGAAYGDLDNDGDPDLIVNNLRQQAFVYKNHADSLFGHRYLTVTLKGTGKNTYAIGAKILVYQNEKILHTQLVPSRGFQSSVDYAATVGLGKGGKGRFSSGNLAGPYTVFLSKSTRSGQNTDRIRKGGMDTTNACPGVPPGTFIL